MTTGLVLGKFAPLHRGHQFMIETALSQVDHLFVLVYEDEGLSKVPLATRARWVRYLYPTVTVIEGHGSPTCTGMDEETKRTQDAYIRSVVPKGVTHFFGSERYIHHVAAALGAIPIMVDQERLREPISATRIRDNPAAMKAWVHPYVYRDLVEKVVLLGAESTGKSTLAKRLAEVYQTTYVPEYGREYWLENRDAAGMLDNSDMIAIAASHRHLEGMGCEAAGRYCFIDTNALTTLAFCRAYGRTPLPLLLHWANQCKDRYQHVFVCDTDIPYEQDGTRGPAAGQAEQQGHIVFDLSCRGIPFTLLRGSLDERVQQVQSTLPL